MTLGLYFILLLAQGFSVLANSVSQHGDESMLWGPYRPNLYFGLQPRIPRGLSFGLMWTTVNGNELDTKRLRHTCEQADAMDGYGWSWYDVRIGGTQHISDHGHNLALSTSFVKTPEGKTQGSWAVRIQGQARDTGTPLNVSTVWYMALGNGTQNGDSSIQCQESSLFGLKDTIECNGHAAGLNSFNIRISPARPGDMRLLSVEVPDDELWKAKDIFIEQLDRKALDSAVEMDAQQSLNRNLFFVQHTFTADFEFDVLFTSNLSSEAMTCELLKNDAGASSPLTGVAEAISPALEKARSIFDTRFQSVFQPKSPFQSERFTEFSQSLLSNLLGGIGYFYGSSLVDTSNQPEYEENAPEFWTHVAAARKHAKVTSSNPTELFTCVPSRPFFPRGFLWDEGFHLLLVLEWDMDLAVEIIQSWLSLMDKNGWIAREQILGSEARSKVPIEFQVQYPQHANPPTLFLAAQALLGRISGEEDYFGAASKYLKDKELGHNLIRDLFSKLAKHYDWFRNSQKGNMTFAPTYSLHLESFRWRGRTLQHTLTSGLDDYPRALPPHPGELHVDATSWVGLMAITLEKISKFLGQDDGSRYGNDLSVIRLSLESIHWSTQSLSYCDTSIGDQGRYHVCHQGYMSLFPFLVRLLEHDHPNVEHVLNLMQDEKKLWSPYGLQSLSRLDEFYGKDENYWRSPIWINMNFLALQRLLELAQMPGPYQTTAQNMYTELRRNVVSTVYDSWNSTGFAWEQYNPDTGAGQRTQHFTGWTPLVVKIMAFPDLGHSENFHQHDFGAKTGQNAIFPFHFFLLAGFVGILILKRRRLFRFIMLTRH